MSKYTFDTASPAFLSGSFLIFRGWDIFETTFYNDLQLRWESADTALSSLLKFVQGRYSGPRFFGGVNEAAKNRVAKRITKEWLGRGAGEKFWGDDHKHINDSEDVEEEGMLEWAIDEWTIQWTVTALLLLIQPHARKLWEERSRFLAEQAAKVEEKEESEEEEEAEEEERPRKRPRLLELPVRQRAV